LKPGLGGRIPNSLLPTPYSLMTTQLRQDIENFCKQFLNEKIDIEDVAMKMQKLADRAWDEAVQDVPPSLQIT
jgi:hypothetical protein